MSKIPRLTFKSLSEVPRQLSCQLGLGKQKQFGKEWISVFWSEKFWPASLRKSLVLFYLWNGKAAESLLSGLILKSLDILVSVWGWELLEVELDRQYDWWETVAKVLFALVALDLQMIPQVMFSASQRDLIWQRSPRFEAGEYLSLHLTLPCGKAACWTLWETLRSWKMKSDCFGEG